MKDNKKRRETPILLRIAKIAELKKTSKWQQALSCYCVCHKIGNTPHHGLCCAMPNVLHSEAVFRDALGEDIKPNTPQ